MEGWHSVKQTAISGYDLDNSNVLVCICFECIIFSSWSEVWFVWTMKQVCPKVNNPQMKYLYPKNLIKWNDGKFIKGTNSMI